MNRNRAPPRQGAILSPHVDQITHVDNDIEAVGKGAHGGLGVDPIRKEHKRADTAHVPEAHRYHTAPQPLRGIPLEVEAAIKDYGSDGTNDITYA